MRIIQHRTATEQERQSSSLNALIGGQDKYGCYHMEGTMSLILRFGGLLSAAVLAASVSGASAQDTNDPGTGGQQNRQWGESASQLAKRSDDSVRGGGMGAHSRSTTAADKNGGFASSDNAFGISFNQKEDGGNAGRDGVGNVSKNAPHNTHPGDGGNGQHAENNDALSSRVDPVTGEAVE
jgi:hypothetical protein